VSRGTWGHPRVLQDFAYGAITLFGRPFQIVLLSIHNPTLGPRNPMATNHHGLGWSAFARRY
jgi:hypothetical protein